MSDMDDQEHDNIAEDDIDISEVVVAQKQGGTKKPWKPLSEKAKEAWKANAANARAAKAEKARLAKEAKEKPTPAPKTPPMQWHCNSSNKVEFGINFLGHFIFLCKIFHRWRGIQYRQFRKCC